MALPVHTAACIPGALECTLAFPLVFLDSCFFVTHIGAHFDQQRLRKTGCLSEPGHGQGLVLLCFCQNPRAWSCFLKAGVEGPRASSGERPTHQKFLLRIKRIQQRFTKTLKTKTCYLTCKSRMLATFSFLDEILTARTNQELSPWTLGGMSLFFCL